MIPRALAEQERELLKRTRFQETRRLLIFGIYMGAMCVYSIRMGTVVPILVLGVFLLLLGNSLLARIRVVHAIGLTLKENRMTAAVSAPSATERVDGTLTLSGRETLFEQLAFGWPWRIGPLPFFFTIATDRPVNGKSETG